MLDTILKLHNICFNINKSGKFTFYLRFSATKRQDTASAYTKTPERIFRARRWKMENPNATSFRTETGPWKAVLMRRRISFCKISSISFIREWWEVMLQSTCTACRGCLPKRSEWLLGVSLNLIRTKINNWIETNGRFSKRSFQKRRDWGSVARNCPGTVISIKTDILVWRSG